MSSFFLFTIFYSVFIFAFEVQGGRIDPSLLNKFKARTFATTDAIIDLSQLNTSDATVAQLQRLTSYAQSPYINKLRQLGLKYESLWVSNCIFVKSLTLNSLLTLERDLDGDFLIREEHKVSILGDTFNTDPSQFSPQWGVDQIGAPAVWSQINGSGILIYVVDTGVDAHHPALSPGFSGLWYDPYYNDPFPSDVHGHGTHVTGTISGRLNGIGVAPGSLWGACRGLDNFGVGSESNLLECCQHALEANPKPHIFSASWGGGQGETWYNGCIDQLRSAGIIPVFAVGNSGSDCSTAYSPGDQPGCIAFGGTDRNDAVASFSSRGPSISAPVKPDFAAPAVAIVSSGLQNNYVSMSGTSMACPHGSGAIALLLSADSTLGYDEIYAALKQSAVRPIMSTMDKQCTPEGSHVYPNQVYGFGRINVAAALDAIK